MSKTTSKSFEDQVTDLTIPFTLVVRVRGGLQSSYVFQNEEQFQHWKKEYFPTLEKKHGPLTYTQDTLPGFKVGDVCGIVGEGMDEFRIQRIFQYSPYRYGYSLDSGWNEEVAKSFDIIAQRKEYEQSCDQGMDF